MFYRLLRSTTSRTRIITKITAMPTTAGIKYMSAADCVVPVVAPGLLLAEDDAALTYAKKICCKTSNRASNYGLFLA